MEARKVSKKGLEFIKEHEKFMPEPYVDPVGILTIGYGHVIRSYEDFTDRRLTEQEATDLMVNDLSPKVNNILSKVNRPLKQNELDALASLVFNIGSGNFNNSTVLRRINNNEPDDRIREAWSWWNKGTVNGVKIELRGLTRRRKEEADLFISGDYIPKKKSY